MPAPHDRGKRRLPAPQGRRRESPPGTPQPWPGASGHLPTQERRWHWPTGPHFHAETGHASHEHASARDPQEIRFARILAHPIDPQALESDRNPIPCDCCKNRAFPRDTNRYRCHPPFVGRPPAPEAEVSTVVGWRNPVQCCEPTGCRVSAFHPEARGNEVSDAGLLWTNGRGWPRPHGDGDERARERRSPPQCDGGESAISTLATVC